MSSKGFCVGGTDRSVLAQSPPLGPYSGTAVRGDPTLDPSTQFNDVTGIAFGENDYEPVAYMRGVMIKGAQTSNIALEATNGSVHVFPVKITADDETNGYYKVIDWACSKILVDGTTATGFFPLF